MCAYTALPDMRMPYDNDGSVFVTSAAGQPYSAGASTYPTGTQLIALNGAATQTASTFAPVGSVGPASFGWWWFFPERREITGAYVGYAGAGTWNVTPVVEGSIDSTNGLDGTWETASISGSLFPAGASNTFIDAWRSMIRPISFTGGKRVLRMRGSADAGWGTMHGTVIHLYGEKVAGQTPDDIIYIDHDTTPGAEYTAPEDFGDRPLATTVTRQFRVKNTSATLTANTINIQCNDADFVISTDGTTWVVTINIASLGPGAQSATMYVRNTTPAVGTALGPRFARIVTTVLSWT